MNNNTQTGPTTKEVEQWLERLAASAKRDGQASEAALQAITRTLVAQSTMLDRLQKLLRNEQVSAERIASALASDTLTALLANIGAPLRTSFSLTDAQEAATSLTRQQHNAKNTTNTLLAAAKLVAVFI